MKYSETGINGAFLIEVEPIEDERGFFARTWCKQEFSRRGLNSDLVQCNRSYNKKRGTLRGMHYQASPHGETKLVSCTRGAVYDVIVDLRENSSTYRKWFATNLSSFDLNMLYIPEGMAHGFLTLEDDSEVFYQMGEYYHSESAKGIRWDDPLIGIKWPIQNDLIISERDRSYPLLR